MDDDSPDYSQYTIAELEDVLVWIDQEKWPERYLEAKAMLAKKIKERAAKTNSEGDQVLPPPPKPKWSEQLLITRILSGSLMVMAFSVIPTLFYKFMVAKSWTANTMGVIWVLAFILAITWYLCLKKDTKFMRYLEATWRGQLAIVTMPFLYLMFSWMFIDKSLPLALHMVLAKQEVRYEMDYEKGSRRKYCSQRLEIIETDELEYGELCTTESNRNSLPESGKITVVGTRSQFGMLIDGFILPR
ncbi:hypothetical protein SAMN06297229_1182 [Pseudidiomarina planktonica]|uniref:Uncharacterized protein n=1 Tax=Pseudidiomarina planktonica TaxID=1323738 RepID=A0A1Y6EX38_9GAMM|nr:hypothetical protein [Pseudidiomarina planktonica]RUO65415.1 hypothetical protein CWI77_02850 [Pseudidiomarina planktonica]SMQ65102.1 hypothetical protein SAMN06297229_1182 [Pseudidiomarina planktonica]